MANRLWHGEFPMDHETWCDMMLSDFPAPSDLPILPAEGENDRERAWRLLDTVAADLRGRAAKP